MEVIIVLLVFAVLLLIGSVAAIAVNRRRSRGVELEPPPSRPQVRPPEAPRPTIPARPEAEPAPQATPFPQPEPEPEPGEPLPEVVGPRPRFRDRLGKARSLLAGYVGSILSRSAIDDETWDEL